MMETVYSELKVRNLLYVSKVNSSFVSSGALNNFDEIFPPVVIHRGEGFTKIIGTPSTNTDFLYFC